MSVQQSQFSFARVQAAIAAAQPADGSITLAKLAVQATATILGNNSGSNASPSALSASAARTLLGLGTADSPTFAGGTFSGNIQTINGTTATSIEIHKTFTSVNNREFFAINSTASAHRLVSGVGSAVTPRNIEIGSAAVTWLRGTAATGIIGCHFGISLSASNDVLAFSGGANVWQHRNGTAGQRHQWYKTYTSDTNNEGFEVDAATNTTSIDLAVCSGSLGGSNREIRIGSKYAGAASLTPWLTFGTGGAATFNGTINARASTTAAGTAPIKIATGVLMTTPEAGAIEYDGTSLYFTDSGGTRRQLAVV
jgi:hypothetical protein